VNWVGGAWYVPLPVSAGDTIGSVSAVVRDNGPAPGYIPGSVGDGGSYVKLSLISETASGSSTISTYGFKRRAPGTQVRG
jgi:hypothetical protein